MSRIVRSRGSRNETGTETPQEFADKAMQFYRNYHAKSQKRTNFIMTTLTVITCAPIIAGIIVGLFAVCIKFIQICGRWVGLL